VFAPIWDWDVSVIKGVIYDFWWGIVKELVVA